MSGLTVASKTRTEQDEYLAQKRATQDQWIEAVLRYPLHTVESGRRTLDRLGLDVPATGNNEPVERPALEELSLARANPEAVRQAFQRRERAKQILTQAKELAKTLDPDAPEGDEKVTGLVEQVGALLGAAPTPEQIEQAENAARQLAELLKTLAEAGELVRKQRAERAKAIGEAAQQAPGTLDAEATAEELNEIEEAASKLAGELQDPVSAQALSLAESALENLKERIGEIARRCENDRARRRETRMALVQRREKAKSDPAATDAEKSQITKLGKLIGELPETPTDEELQAATEAAVAVEKAVTALAEQVAQRRIRFEKASVLLRRLAAEAPGLKPHPRAPAGDTDPVLEDAEKLRLETAKFTDWAQVATWDDKALVELEDAIAALETRMAGIKKLTEERIVKVDEVLARLTDAIANAKDRPFSGIQQNFLKGLITPQTNSFAQDTASADAVVQALNEQVDAASALSRALAALARRLAAVAPPPEASLSPKEKEALTKARDAATMGLDEVTET